jgi:hypothetical protein
MTKINSYLTIFSESFYALLILLLIITGETSEQVFITMIFVVTVYLLLVTVVTKLLFWFLRHKKIKRGMFNLLFFLSTVVLLYLLNFLFYGMTPFLIIANWIHGDRYEKFPLLFLYEGLICFLSFLISVFVNRGQKENLSGSH